MVLLDNQNTVASAGQIEGGGEPSWPTADNHRVVEVFDVGHCKLLNLRADQQGQGLASESQRLAAT